MRSNYSFDKTGFFMGLCVMAVGGFIDPLVIVLGGMMVVSGIVAYLVERYKSGKHMNEEMAEEVFFEEVVQQATGIPIR